MENIRLNTSQWDTPSLPVVEMLFWEQEFIGSIIPDTSPHSYEGKYQITGYRGVPTFPCKYEETCSLILLEVLLIIQLINSCENLLHQEAGDLVGQSRLLHCLHEGAS